MYDSHNRPVDMTREGLQKIFEREAKRLLPGLGATEHFYTIPPRNRDDNTVAVEIHTGTARDEQFLDTYNISMGDKRKVPDFDYFEKAIEIFEPFEAFLAEAENEFRLNAFDRERVGVPFTKPGIIRGFHYLDAGMAESIGGIEYCLKAPAWNVDRFCKGVLIELVLGLFDSNNPEHLEVQEDVMEYFHLV
jgi:hypothetical protein